MLLFRCAHRPEVSLVTVVTQRAGAGSTVPRAVEPQKTAHGLLRAARQRLPPQQLAQEPAFESFDQLVCVRVRILRLRRQRTADAG